jgi:hypothetical protein
MYIEHEQLNTLLYDLDSCKNILHKRYLRRKFDLLSKDASFLHTTILTMCTAKNNFKFRS